MARLPYLLPGLIQMSASWRVNQCCMADLLLVGAHTETETARTKFRCLMLLFLFAFSSVDISENVWSRLGYKCISKCTEILKHYKAEQNNFSGTNLLANIALPILTHEERQGLEKTMLPPPWWITMFSMILITLFYLFMTCFHYCKSVCLSKHILLSLNLA